MIDHDKHIRGTDPATVCPDRPDGAGSALIGLILVMLLISFLGISLLSQTTTASFTNISANSSDRAFYLAESGFRYAAAKMAAGSDLNSLHGRTFSLSDTEHFTLSFEPHIFRVTHVQNRWLTIQTAYGVLPPFTDHQLGRLKINNGPTEIFDRAQTQSAVQVRFRRATGHWTATVGDLVTFVVLSDGTPVPAGGTLNLQAATPADIFPAYHAHFQLNGVLYRYVSRGNHQLQGITRADGAAWTPLTPAVNDEVMLQPFVKVESTGIFGQGTLGTQRLITYHAPVGMGGAPAAEWHDAFDSGMGNWNTAQGGHQVVESNGGALRVTAAGQTYGGLYESRLNLNWSAADVDLATAWANRGGLLNYDTQVKTRIEEPYYMAGISFRQDDSGNSYGVSFLKASPDSADGIPDTIVPVVDQSMIVLWERADANVENWNWLAYKILDPGSFVQRTTFFEDDMESGTGQWTADAPWSLVANSPPANDPPSPTRCWHDSPGGNSPENADISIVSRRIDLSTAIAPRLSFYHRYELHRYWFLFTWFEDHGDVEISTNNGSSWTRLARYNGTQAQWTPVDLDLAAYAGNPDVRIRFRLQTRDWLLSVNNPGDGWYIDDVRITGEHISWPTLLVRAREKIAPSGTPFEGRKVNDIQVFFGDSTASGQADGNPLDAQRLANARGQINWPPEDVNTSSADDDYFTLVQWDAVNNLGSIALHGNGIETNTILRSDNPILATPASGSFSPSRPEIGLHTWGVRWSGGGYITPIEPPVVYFDDFAVRLPGRTGAHGFGPALQQ